MPKKTDLDYCLWRANCVSLGVEESFEGCDLYRCCYTCPKKAECEYPCKDRDKAPHNCPYISSKEEVEAKMSYKFSCTNPPKVKKESPLQSCVDQTSLKKRKESSKQKRGLTKPIKQKSKTLWEVSAPLIPTSVKELAAQTGATYARANYLIKAKGMSFTDALRVLKS